MSNFLLGPSSPRTHPVKQNVFWFIHDSENSDDDDDEVEYIELGSDQDVLSDQKESLPQQSELITPGKLQSKRLSRLRNILSRATYHRAPRYGGVRT